MNDFTKNKILGNLNENQVNVCRDESNILLTACPGSGKTRTITHKIAYLKEKYIESNLLIIAITYTNRAANELEHRLERLIGDLDNIWCGTIHQFCLNYIIKPYGMYHNDLKKGYVIIDDFKSKEYKNNIAQKYGYKNYNGLDTKILNEDYQELLKKNRELDFDKILLISKELLVNNNFVSENISNIIRCINVDEYQDTNIIQYEILSEIYKANNKISIMFVGDINQSIYTSLGSVAMNKEDLDRLFRTNFKELILSGCYRSTSRIIDFYKKFENVDSKIYSLAKNKSCKGVIKYDSKLNKEYLSYKICEIIKNEMENGLSSNEICVVAPQWRLLYPIAEKIKKILPDIDLDSPNISIVKYDPMNIFYLITFLIFTRNYRNSFLRRKMAKQLMQILEEEYYQSLDKDLNYLDILFILNDVNYIEENSIETIKLGIESIFTNLKINRNDQLIKDYNSFFDSILSRIKTYNISVDCNSVQKSFSKRSGITVNTIHGIKGEEYTTVIAFGLLEGILPNWDVINNSSKEEKELITNNLLYVLASRSKENLYLFSESGRKTYRSEDYLPTNILKNYKFDYD